MTLRTLLDRFDLLMDTPESVPKLRRFILRLALRGRLTEQRTEDADIDALVERLRTEKQRLYDEGEIRKPRSLDPLDDGEDWHQVPSEWRWTKVGEVGRIIGGSTPRTSNDEYWADQGIAWLTPGDLGDHDGKMVSRGDRDISEKGLDSCSATLLPPGSVLFSSRAPIGYVAIAADELSTNQGFKSVRPYEMAMSHYIYWFLKYAGKRINDEASGTTFTEVSGTDLANIPFPLPPLEEQQRIVETVDRLMDECDALEQQQERERTLQVQVGTAATEALQSADGAEAPHPAWERVREHFDTVTATPEGVDALRQTILQLAVQGRLTERDPDDTPADVLLEQIQQEKQRLYDAGEIRKPKDLSPVTDPPVSLPSHWNWTRVGEITGMQGGYAFKSSWYENEGIRLVRNTNISHGYIDWSETARLPNQQANEFERFQLRKGDILLSLDRPIISTGLKVARVTEEDLPALLVQRVGRFELEVSAIDNDYFFYWLHSPHFLEGIDPGRSNAIPHISQKEVLKLPFPLPPLSEQERIARTLARLLPLCDRLNERVANLSERGEQLLEAALSNAATDSPDRMPAQVAS